VLVLEEREGEPVRTQDLGRETGYEILIVEAGKEDRNTPC
jgi:hypothetical protein